MITTLGKQHIRAYLAGQVPAIAQAISIGTNDVAPTAGDVDMGFEVARVPITSVSLDPTTDKIVFKGTIENPLVSYISEIGLWTSNSERDSTLVTTFGADEEWSSGMALASSTDGTNRIGDAMMVVQSNQVITALSSDTDLSHLLGPDDKWTFAMAVGSPRPTQTATATFTIYSTDGGSIALPFTFPPASSGYQYSTIKVRDGVQSGVFNSEKVDRFEVKVTASDGGVFYYSLDGVVANNAQTERESSLLVARSIITPPFTTRASTATDVEYELGVTL